MTDTMSDSVRVPSEPTEAMLSKGAIHVRDFITEKGPYPRTRAMYKAMLAAAPAPTADVTDAWKRREEIERKFYEGELATRELMMPEFVWLMHELELMQERISSYAADVREAVLVRDLEELLTKHRSEAARLSALKLPDKILYCCEAARADGVQYALELVKSALASRPAMDEVSAWHSMDSAPKNGEFVDLLYPYPRGRTINCVWSKNFGWHWFTPHWENGELQPRDKWNVNHYPNMEPYAWMYSPSDPTLAAMRAATGG